MGQVASERVVNGIKTRVLHGKDYVEVAERVRIAHSQEHQFEMVESQPIQLGARIVWRVMGKVDGKQYIGHAEVKLDAPKNTPDGTNPFECAETSAVGRLLAFAGLGTVESIASFDEVRRSEYIIEEANNGHGRIVEATKPKALPEGEVAIPAPDDAPTPAQLRARHKALGLQMSFEQIVEKCFNRPIADDELTPTQCTYLSKVYDRKASEKATSAGGDAHDA